MYKPFVDTISKLFSQSKFLYNKWKNIDFKKNDIIICIGCHFTNKDLKKLKNKKVYIIFYWTEPCVVHKAVAQYCDEIYLYSKFLFTLQQKHFDQQKIKFVPVLKEDTTSFVNYLNKTLNCFF
mgnify:CR=1 FL=1